MLLVLLLGASASASASISENVLMSLSIKKSLYIGLNAQNLEKWLLLDRSQGIITVGAFIFIFSNLLQIHWEILTHPFVNLNKYTLQFRQKHCKKSVWGARPLPFCHVSYSGSGCSSAFVKCLAHLNIGIRDACSTVDIFNGCSSSLLVVYKCSPSGHLVSQTASMILPLAGLIASV